jgi:hypothetical protein
MRSARARMVARHQQGEDAGDGERSDGEQPGGRTDPPEPGAAVGRMHGTS